MAETKRNKELVVGDPINKLDETVEKVRELAKDIYNTNPPKEQVRGKDIYIRAIIGSKVLIDRVYKYNARLYHGRISTKNAWLVQLINEVQFLDWLQNKLNDIYIAEYQANLNHFGDAQDMEKPKIHKGRRTKEEQFAIDKWNWLHPEDPIENIYENRNKKQK